MAEMQKSSTRKRKTNLLTKIKRKIKPGQRFLAMSKLIGFFIAIAVLAIMIYAMYEMHCQNDLSSLSQLIISVFGFGSVYIDFYLTMARWEHVEAEKTAREKEVLKLKKQLGVYNETEQLEENIEQLTEKVEELNQKADNIIADDITGNADYY